MAQKEHEQVVAFDTLFSTNHIQMLKVILPFMNHQTQKFMAVCIKFLELQYTIDFCRKHPFSLRECADPKETSDIANLCSKLLPFCNRSEKQHLEQIQTALKSMETYREMSKTMEIMKDFMPDMGDFFQNMQAASLSDTSTFSAVSSADANTPSDIGSVPASGFDITNILLNMMTPEQKEMYEMFKGDFQNAE